MTTSLRPYPQYKPSSIEWLGDIPIHWDTVQLNRVAGESKLSNRAMEETTVLSLSYGRVIIKDPDKKGLMPENFNTYQIVNPGNIILRLTDLQNDQTSLRVGLAKNRGIITSAYVCLNPNSRVDSSYLYRLLHSFDEGKHLYGMGSGVRQGLSYKELRREPFPLPPLDEQRAIADFLDRTDAKITRFIASRRRMIALLEEKKQAIINHAVTRGLDPTVPMKDSGVEWLGEIPAHWRFVPLRRLVREPLQYGANAPSRLFDPELPRYVRITDITSEGTLAEDGARSISAVEAAPYILEEGDVLLARSGATVGKSYLHTGFNGEAAFAGYLIRARTNPALISAEFLASYLGSGFYWQWIKSISIQATIENVSAEKYASLVVPVPPLHDQEAIVDHLNRVNQKLFKQKSLLRRETELMQEYRTRLISDVVTGKVSVV